MEGESRGKEGISCLLSFSLFQLAVARKNREGRRAQVNRRECYPTRRKLCMLLSRGGVAKKEVNSK
jgi:hypothetical protein